MNNIYEFIKKNNNCKNIIILAIMSLVTYILMGTNILGILKNFNEDYMLDLKFFYTGSYFVDTFQNISSIQVGYYQTIHLIDYVFIISFYPLLAFSLARLITNKYKVIILIPLLGMLFDFLENITIDLYLHIGLPKLFGSFCGLFTMFKFTLIVITIILLITFYLINRSKK